jgi:Uma2 family endonuclease
MTAQPVTHDGVFAMWQPDPIRQRLADYTIEDVLNLPEDAPRVELVDGVMVVVPSPTAGHQNIGSLLWSWFRRHAPSQYLFACAVGVMVTPSLTYEPDLLLFDREAGLGRHYYLPRQVTLAVEIVSPGTRKKDRLVKPVDYARAGVPYYWRIEQDPVHVFAYRLSKGGGYELVADSAELLELSEPFEIKLPIDEITP